MTNNEIMAEIEIFLNAWASCAYFEAVDAKREALQKWLLMLA